MKQYIGTKIVHAESLDRGDGMNGYRVVYSDGYESWSPTAAFEEAYRANGEMNFGHALLMLKSGQKVQRSGWNGKGLWLELQVPDAHSKMTLPYIFMSYPADAQNTPGARVPWLASQTDMLADDWCVVDGEA